VAQRANLEKPELVVVNPLDVMGWTEFLATYRPAFATQLKEEAPSETNAVEWSSTKKMLASFPWTMAYVAPRGIGPTGWDQSAKKQTQHRRRFYLLGQTLEGMQT
jgi:hypothetical protein